MRALGLALLLAACTPDGTDFPVQPASGSVPPSLGFQIGPDAGGGNGSDNSGTNGSDGGGTPLDAGSTSLDGGGTNADVDANTGPGGFRQDAGPFLDSAPPDALAP